MTLCLDYETCNLKANYWLTGEPNTKGSLYIDLGCVVEVLCCKALDVVESNLQVVGFRVKNTHNYIWNDYSTNQVYIMKTPQSQSLKSNHPSCRSSKSICETGNSSFLARCYSLTPTQINLRDTHPPGQIPHQNNLGIHLTF